MGEASFRLSSGALREWVETAEYKAQCVYAIGEQLPQPIGSTARGLYEAGLVTLARHRDTVAQPFEFMVIRTAAKREAPREKIKASPVMHARRREQMDAEAAGAAVMAALVAAAEARDFCPTNARLAEIANLPTAEHASKIVCMLRDEARIDVAFSGSVGRIVTIKASGRSTRSSAK